MPVCVCGCLCVARSRVGLNRTSKQSQGRRGVGVSQHILNSLACGCCVVLSCTWAPECVQTCMHSIKLVDGAFMAHTMVYWQSALFVARFRWGCSATNCCARRLTCLLQSACATALHRTWGTLRTGAARDASVVSVLFQRFVGEVCIIAVGHIEHYWAFCPCWLFVGMLTGLAVYYTCHEHAAYRGHDALAYTLFDGMVLSTAVCECLTRVQEPWKQCSSLTDVRPCMLPCHVISGSCLFSHSWMRSLLVSSGRMSQGSGY